MNERDRIEGVACPTCFAVIGDYCQSAKGEPLTANHFYAQRYCHIARVRLADGWNAKVDHTAWPVGRSPA